MGSIYQPVYIKETQETQLSLTNCARHLEILTVEKYCDLLTGGRVTEGYWKFFDTAHATSY